MPADHESIHVWNIFAGVERLVPGTQIPGLVLRLGTCIAQMGDVVPAPWYPAVECGCVWQSHTFSSSEF